MFKKQADTIRFLCADMVQKANSGHPGAPMGLADIMSVLVNHIKHNPKNPTWLNRDRLVFSGGHASSLVYSYLYLCGYDVSLDDLKKFRQLHSKTPGHPEIETPGVEIATGPLGQGVANAVGFAMAAKSASNLLGNEIINHKVYCLCGDGDLEEGISYEACALAGKHSLDNLVIIYDSNNITIEGDTSIAWCEDVKVRFEAAGFEVARIDGHNYDEIEFALCEADTKEKPYLIIASTKIAKGAGDLEGSHHAHGAPLGEEIIKQAKIEAGFDPQKQFFVDDDVLFKFRSAVELGDLANAQWDKLVSELPNEKKELLNTLLNPDFSKIDFPNLKGEKLATRDSNGKILNALAAALPGFIGGSADLAPSNKTELKGFGDFPRGKNMHFGIREHAMGAICNAYARYGLFLPFSATFFIFSDYLKASARIAALMGIKHFFVWTHDSIGVGEDGPTHEPIEQLSTFRAMPNFYSFRPADGNENVECWKTALNLNAPSAFVCSRQALPPLDEPKFGDVKNGAYLLKQASNPKITLVASGSEVGLCLEAASILDSEGIATNVVSAPCFDLLLEQDADYVNTIFNPSTKVLAVEAASALEWYKYADDVLGMRTFGASAPANELFKYFGFTATNVANRAKNLL
ncbi:transketolase [Campylobacter fetus]|uniref:Transketolase n=3 Tax=Campylobacter fetus TaxID=196 RepID=A0AAE6IWX7_CAMFE|nr:transketolase [Campylobacter fetus]OCS22494.1 transketolase [Campylobacter fetus subsp. venerealis cfvi97/532]OCS26492.1 transketolase [Campylobacter fetus subsp. venerealis cfvB10]OCS29889.1 transketolase [Campylobacter fetus subsp. venerealis LMG 6570 = CCUG 33900]OCS43224.1 transketolase [Campylobacter fetus subsp. venerealis cfvi02/298]ABK82746.1 transketolase [Campylobacter fetus subsp. fetus 82-40]